MAVSLPVGCSASPPGPGPAATESPGGLWALRLAGVLGAGAACPVFSSEKSCLITSKKLLNGLPGYTEQKTREKKGRERGGEGRRENKRVNTRASGEKPKERQDGRGAGTGHSKRVGRRRPRALCAGWWEGLGAGDQRWDLSAPELQGGNPGQAGRPCLPPQAWPCGAALPSPRPHTELRPVTGPPLICPWPRWLAGPLHSEP